MWRYREAIPIANDEDIVTFEEGSTPLLELEVADRPVLFKQEQLFPTGSFKDRGAAVLISRARELGLDEVVEDSSGNAGCAVAAYCAAAGIRCHIYVPEKTSPSKLAQIASYGAVLHRVPGSRQDTADAALTAAETRYYASHVWNPFFFHGTKTFAYEVAEQLSWTPPDEVVLPVGNGTLLLGAYIGFRELRDAGLIQAMPRIIAVQAQNCAPLARAFNGDADPREPGEAKATLAEGIAITRPPRGQQILNAVRRTRGRFVTVSEDEIVAALQETCRRGYYIEPTAAATVAGVRKHLALQSREQVVVSAFSGHGLKSTEKIMGRLP
jgi:threonine synthase